MEVVLCEATLKNFRGVTGKFKFNPERTIFSGPNGSGKTTLFDSSTWLLFGKDSLGSSDFAIKSIVGGKKVSKTDHSVFQKYEVNKMQIEFGRCFYENWTKKRGAVEETKEGNKTKYFVDGIDLPKTKYMAKVIETFGENYQMVSDLTYFVNMPWKEKRSILSSLATSVDQEKIIDSISGLRELVGNKPIEERKLSAEQRKKKVVKEIGVIPAKIAENKIILDSAGELSLEDAEKAILACKEEITSHQQKIDSLTSGDKSESVKKLQVLNSKLFLMQEEFSKEKLSAHKKVLAHEAEYEVIVDGINYNSKDLQDHKDELIVLRIKWAEIKADSIDSINSICKECGQELPAEKVEELKKNFLFKQAERLKENQERGKDVSKEYALIESKIAEFEAQKVELEKFKPEVIIGLSESKDMAAVRKEINDVQKQQPATTIPPEMLQTSEALEIRLEQARDKKSAIKSVADSQIRIDALNIEKVALSTENDKISLFLSKYDEYNKLVAEQTEGPVNSMFKNVNFQMFETLENGNTVQCCNVFDKEMRPYNGGLSNGERIQAGVDIIRTLQKHYEVQVPVFIDNSEALTSPVELDCQVIELCASNEFKILTKG